MTWPQSLELEVAEVVAESRRLFLKEASVLAKLRPRRCHFFWFWGSGASEGWEGDEDLEEEVEDG